MGNKVFEILDKLDIKYDKAEHEAVYHVAESQKIDRQLEGIGCKTLFLKDKENNYYLYVIRGTKRADLKDVASKLQCTRLSFGKEEELYEKVGLRPGSVSPFGIINDNGEVGMIIDNELVENKIVVHPNVNTISLSIRYEDLIKVIENYNNKYYIV